MAWKLWRVWVCAGLISAFGPMASDAGGIVDLSLG